MTHLIIEYMMVYKYYIKFLAIGVILMLSNCSDTIYINLKFDKKLLIYHNKINVKIINIDYQPEHRLTNRSYRFKSNQDKSEYLAGICYLVVEEIMNRPENRNRKSVVIRYLYENINELLANIQDKITQNDLPDQIKIKYLNKSKLKKALDKYYLINKIV